MSILDNPQEKQDNIQEMLKNFGGKYPTLEDGKTTDWSKVPHDTMFSIKCSSAISGDTPILISDSLTITNMRNVFMFQSNQNLPIYALHNGAAVSNSHMIGIPKEIPTMNICDIGFSNGFHLSADPNTNILTAEEHWKAIKDFLPGEKVFGAYFDTDQAQLGIQKREYTVIGSEVKKTIMQNVYLFLAEHGNMLLPQVAEDNSSISFICIQQ